MDIGKYKVFKDRLLGSGGYSQVYLGEDFITKNKVAIKILDKSSDKIKKDRILKEYDILRKLHHKNIVEVYDLLEDEKFFYIILMYIPNTLKQFERDNHPLSENFVLVVISQIIDALEYMHSKKIIHMDIKLSNILIDENLNVYLTDFGFAEEFTEKENLLKRHKGTIYYAAPESYVRITRKPYSGYKADVWSLGICMFILLHHNVPFRGNKDTIYENIKNNPLRIKNNISHTTRILLKKMLEKNPEERPSIYEVQDIVNLLSVFSISSLQRYLSEEYGVYHSKEIVRKCIKKIKKSKGVTSDIQLIKLLIPNKFFLDN